MLQVLDFIVVVVGFVWGFCGVFFLFFCVLFCVGVFFQWGTAFTAIPTKFQV